MFELVEARRYGFLWRNRLSGLPRIVSDAAAGVAVVNGLDTILERLFSTFCQNWSFVLVKRSRADKG
jgi:hypothetical protein